MDRNQPYRRHNRDRNQERDYSRNSQIYAGSGYDDDDDDRGYGGSWSSDYGQSESDSFEAYRSLDRGGSGGERGRGGSSGRGSGFSDRGDSRSSGGYGRSYYGDREGGRGFGSFNSNDFGGRDFSGPQRNYGPGRDPSDQYGPYGGRNHGGSYGGSSYGRSSGGGGYSGGDYSGGGSRGGYSGEAGGYGDSGWSGGGRGYYGERSGYRGGGSSYSRGDRGRDDRGFFERASDEVASWFGDEEAARRREMDHTGRGPQNYKRSDERVLEDACDRLTADWGVDASNIQVTVQNGELTLDGTVSSRPQKRRAEDCVDDLPGVKHVQNNLRVQESGGWSGTGGSSADRADTTGTVG